MNVFTCEWVGQSITCRVPTMADQLKLWSGLTNPDPPSYVVLIDPSNVKPIRTPPNDYPMIRSTYNTFGLAYGTSRSSCTSSASRSCCWHYRANCWASIASVDVVMYSDLDDSTTHQHHVGQMATVILRRDELISH